MKTIRLPFLPVLLFCLAVLAPAYAQETKLIGSFGDWEAYQESEGGKIVCYIGSEPKKSMGKYKTRGDAYVLVTHRPAEKTTHVVSVKAGYTFQNGSEVDVAIGNQNFRLFTDAGHAFAYDKKADKDMGKAMARGAKMIVKGISSRGTKTTDIYSLIGFSAALKAIGKACKVK